MFAARALAVIGTGAIMLVGCGDGATGDDTDAMDGGGGGAATQPAEEREVTMDIEEQGDSGVSGTATLTERDGETHVVVDVDDPEGDALRPTHIHRGTCDDLDPAPEYPLEDTTEGTSETTVDVPLSELLEGEYAINLHESVENLENYIACGNVPSEMQ